MAQQTMLRAWMTFPCLELRNAVTLGPYEFSVAELVAWMPYGNAYGRWWKRG